MRTFIIVTAIHQDECGLFIFSIKMRNERGEWEPVRYWSYQTFAQAMLNRERILTTKFPVSVKAAA